jgi:hypothetical protein
MLNFRCSIAGLTVLVVAGASACGEPPLDQGEETVANVSQAVAAPGKLRTPAGEFDLSCAHEVPNGSVVDLEGNVMQNGKQVARFSPCTAKQTMVLPRITKPGLQPPTINGWVEASWADATTISGLTYFNSLTASFTVPAAPSVAAGQLIYLFPSVEANGAAILQPVLQWGNNGSFGGNYWTLASWYVSATSAVFSSPVTVAAGDSITGFIRMIGSGSSTDSWVVTGTDTVSGVSSGTGFITPKTPFNSAQQGVLEVYNVSACSSFPAAGDIIFSDVTATQAGPAWNTYNAVTPGWFSVVWGGTPSCSFKVNDFGSGGTTGTTLYF